MRWAARSRGFESLPLRHLAKPNGVNAERSKLTPGGNRGGIGAKPQALGHSPEGTESIPPSPPSFAPGLRMARPISRSTKFLPAVIALLRRMPSIALAKEGLSPGLRMTRPTSVSALCASPLSRSRPHARSALDGLTVSAGGKNNNRASAANSVKIGIKAPERLASCQSLGPPPSDH